MAALPSVQRRVAVMLAIVLLLCAAALWRYGTLQPCGMIVRSEEIAHERGTWPPADPERVRQELEGRSEMACAVNIIRSILITSR